MCNAVHSSSVICKTNSKLPFLSFSVIFFSMHILDSEQLILVDKPLWTRALKPGHCPKHETRWEISLWLLISPNSAFFQKPRFYTQKAPAPLFFCSPMGPEHQICYLKTYWTPVSLVLLWHLENLKSSLVNRSQECNRHTRALSPLPHFYSQALQPMVSCHLLCLPSPSTHTTSKLAPPTILDAMYIHEVG